MGKRILRLALTLAIVIPLCISCRQRKTVLKSPPGYDFSQMEEAELNDELDEISGIAWDHRKNIFAAIKDERGRIYMLDKESKQITAQYNLAGTGDFEDLAFADSVLYMMESNGTLYRCDLDTGQSSAATKLGKLQIEGKVDFESLYFDSTRNSVVLLCKNCEIDDREFVSAYAYNLDSGAFSKEPIYRINVDSVKMISGKDARRIEPSAAAIHPITKKLYIISSGSNQLLISDLNGNVESTFVLAEKYFPQPEGLSFKRNGEMFITNEGGTGRASLLRMRYNRK